MSEVAASAAAAAVASPRYVLLAWLLGPGSLLAGSALVAATHDKDWMVPSLLIGAYGHWLAAIITLLCLGHRASRRCLELWLLLAYLVAAVTSLTGAITERLSLDEQGWLLHGMRAIAIAVPVVSASRWLLRPRRGSAAQPAQ